MVGLSRLDDLQALRRVGSRRRRRGRPIEAGRGAAAPRSSPERRSTRSATTSARSWSQTRSRASRRPSGASPRTAPRPEPARLPRGVRRRRCDRPLRALWPRARGRAPGGLLRRDPSGLLAAAGRSSASTATPTRRRWVGLDRFYPGLVAGRLPDPRRLRLFGGAAGRRRVPAAGAGSPSRSSGPFERRPLAPRERAGADRCRWGGPFAVGARARLPTTAGNERGPHGDPHPARARGSSAS